jgi:hypothetical protein
MNQINGCVGVVDVTRVQIQKPGFNERSYYSAKDKFHALKYEVAVSLNPDARIIWLCGPFVGSASDITIAREYLVPLLEAGNETMLADKGYIGEDVLICPIKENANAPLGARSIDFNLKLNKTRQIIERTNKRLKHFKALSSVWRHDNDLNKRCFGIIGRITNLCFSYEPL